MMFNCCSSSKVEQSAVVINKTVAMVIYFLFFISELKLLQLRNNSTKTFFKSTSKDFHYIRIIIVKNIAWIWAKHWTKQTAVFQIFVLCNNQIICCFF